MKVLRKITDSMVFQNTILVIIIFNTVLMGLQTISGLSPETAAVLCKLFRQLINCRTIKIAGILHGMPAIFINDTKSYSFILRQDLRGP